MRTQPPKRLENMKTQNNVPAPKELKKQFSFICLDQLQYELNNNQYKTAAGFLKHLEKENEKNRAKAEKQDVKSIDIRIEWKKSRMWGYNPYAEYWCTYKDGSVEYGKETCSGCGYDKASTVVAAIFNTCCCGMLWRRRNSKKETPYGIYRGASTWYPFFDGGIGVSCFSRIAEFLGGKFTTVSSGRSYDHYNVQF